MAIRNPGRPGVATPTASGGGGYATGLGAAIGAVGQAIGAKRDKESKRKADLMSLRAKNKFAATWDEWTASGALDGLSAQEALQRGESAMDEVLVDLQGTDEVEAERTRLALRTTLSSHVAAQRAQEEKDAQAELLATYTEAETRGMADFTTSIREAMVAKTEEEANAYFQAAGTHAATLF